jgi:LPXTG-motif cell wall-anchored protein
VSSTSVAASSTTAAAGATTTTQAAVGGPTTTAAIGVGGPTTTASGAGAHGLPHTGTDTTNLLVAAGMLISGGAVVMGLGRRRRNA